MARRTHNADDLFLAGRRLGWLPIGLSLFASNISSTTMIVLAGACFLVKKAARMAEQRFIQAL